ncbi:hypothetical protein ACFVP3_23630 [Streptomyces sp. NPDC057806]|uniref:hypothetical protein n=1 Tax=Streptomyces sp. NPDC057806 TaxID=3346255 RepID=UPI0036C63D01
MTSVTMRHPDLPGQPISVPASAVPHHRASGWETVDDTPSAPATEPTPPTAAAELHGEEPPAEETFDPKPARRRRETLKGE